MKNLKVKLQNNNEIKENNCRVLNEYESYGIIEKVDHIAEPGEAHYFPHRAMLKTKRKHLRLG